jgi:hypothetical protein
MWRKTLGLAFLAFMAIVLSGCHAHHRGYYRDAAPTGYVQVRVGPPHGRVFARRPAYRAHRYQHPGRYYQHPGRYDRHRHHRGCGHRW